MAETRHWIAAPSVVDTMPAAIPRGNSRADGRANFATRRDLAFRPRRNIRPGKRCDKTGLVAPALDALTRNLASKRHRAYSGKALAFAEMAEVVVSAREPIQYGKHLCKNGGAERKPRVAAINRAEGCEFSKFGGALNSGVGDPACAPIRKTESSDNSCLVFESHCSDALTCAFDADISIFRSITNFSEFFAMLDATLATIRKTKHCGVSSLTAKSRCTAGINAAFAKCYFFETLKSQEFSKSSAEVRKHIRRGELFSTSCQNTKSRCAAVIFALFCSGSIFGRLKFLRFFGPAGTGEKHIRRGEVFGTSCLAAENAVLLAAPSALDQGDRKPFIFCEYSGSIRARFGARAYIRKAELFGTFGSGVSGEFSGENGSEGFAAGPFWVVNSGECLTEINAEKLPDFSKSNSQPASSESITGINAGALPDLAIPKLSESITGISGQASREFASLNSGEAFTRINVRFGDSPFEETRLADSSIRVFPFAPVLMPMVCSRLRARRHESHSDTAVTPRYRIDSMMAVKSESTVNPRVRTNTEPRAESCVASHRIANETVRSAMSSIAAKSIAISKSANTGARHNAASSSARLGVPLTAPERARHEAELAAMNAVDRHAVAKKARRNGMKRRQVRAPDGTVQEVWSFASSFHAMGFQDPQIAAAERLAADWQSAYRGLRAQIYEPAVDGGRPPHGPHLAQVSAQARLAACKHYLGQRAYDVAVAVAIYGATAREIHALGGKEHRTVKSDMDVAFNELDAFYTNVRRKDRTWTAVEEFIRGRAAMIQEAER